MPLSCSPDPIPASRNSVAPGGNNIILDRMAGENPERRRPTEEARVNAAAAQLIYAARHQSDLSQTELAERIGTQQSVISRLEDADYQGHSLSML